MSLRTVAKLTGISDPYLYQIEKGKRALVDPTFFRKLADYFSINVTELLKKAGYIPDNNTKQKIEKCYLKSINDPDFETGKFLKNKEVSFETKCFIVELYGELLLIKEDKKNG